MDHDRRKDDQEMARWRGGIEERVIALEREIGRLAKSAAAIDRATVRLEATLGAVQREMKDSRDEVREAAAQIDKGREAAVTALTETISEHEKDAKAWRLTRFQLIVGALITIIVGSIPTIITLAATGKIN